MTDRLGSAAPMSRKPQRTWRVVVRRWEEHELRIEADSKEEAEDRALELYSDLPCVDEGNDWIEAEAEDA